MLVGRGAEVRGLYQMRGRRTLKHLSSAAKGRGPVEARRRSKGVCYSYAATTNAMTRASRLGGAHAVPNSDSRTTFH